MALKQYSAFIYGHTITASNKFLNFIEPTIDNIELTAELSIGAYSIQKYIEILSTALNEAGNQEYTVTLDRTNGANLITISAPSQFSLLVNSGSNSSSSNYALAGFTGSDRVGATSYQGDSRSGSVYITQTPIQNFSNFEDNKEKAEASVKSTANGIVEVISFETLERMKADLPLITNYIPQKFIRETATGIEEARAFMDYAITKAPVQFVQSIDDYNTAISCILDSTSRSRSGVGYELRERVRDSLAGYYQLNGLQFLKVEDR